MKTMKTISIKYLLCESLAAATLLLVTGGCGKSDISPYTSSNKLWFEEYQQVNGNYISVTKIKRSFSHYPKATQILDVPFQINLIGELLNEDREYKVVAVDSLTTAERSDYEILPTLFHAHQTVDTLWVRILKNDHLTTDQVKVTLYLVDNEHFEQGFSNNLTIGLTFDNIPSKPDWWTKNIKESYLGPYTSEKFEAFYAFSGMLEIASDVPPSILRKLMHEFRAYIEENDIREADGSPMVIPVM